MHSHLKCKLLFDWPEIMHTPRVLTALLTASALLLAGCSTAEVNSLEAQSECSATQLPLEQLVADANPTGPATACMSEVSVPVTDNATTPKLPATVTDTTGTEVTVESLDRVLALDISGSIAATVFGLGLGDTLVGRDSSTAFAEAEDLPLVTQGGHTLSAEPILALNPTLIITDGSLGPNRVLLQLRESGVPVVYVTDVRNIDAMSTLTMQVADAMGVPERGVALNEKLNAEVDEKIAQIAKLGDGSSPRAMFLYLRGTSSIYYLFGAESGADTLITSLGATDVATELGWKGSQPATAEAIVAAQPDVIFVMTEGLNSVGGVDGLLTTIPAIAQTPAGQNRRIIDMADSQILSFGPRTANVLDALARALYAPSTLSGDAK